jgi:hypothetical protein
MITLYDPKTAKQPLSPSFFHHIEQRRYEWLEAQCRAAGIEGAAELCRKWADDHRLTIVKLAEVDERIAALDVKLGRKSA